MELNEKINDKKMGKKNKMAMKKSPTVLDWTGSPRARPIHFIWSSWEVFKNPNSHLTYTIYVLIFFNQLSSLKIILNEFNELGQVR